MICKSRERPKGIVLLEPLKKRMQLDNKIMHYYSSLKKGYEGEKLFDCYTEKLQCECFILNDLLFEVNNTTFQLDTLLITHGKVFIFEVKNYEGDYYYEMEKLFKKPKLKVINPIHQLSRSESLFQQLLFNIGINIPIEASVVFVNPEFTLYQAPLDKPMIFHGQLNSYMKKLNKFSSNLTKYHSNIANKLMKLHITDSPYQQLPSYQYNQLKKGITCKDCHSFSMQMERKYCFCQECGAKELVSESVLRSVNEFKTLFPHEKITTNIVYDWCKIIDSKKRIARYLGNNYEMAGTRQWAYYK